jgi:hypothetical protein
MPVDPKFPGTGLSAKVLAVQTNGDPAKATDYLGT